KYGNGKSMLSQIIRVLAPGMKYESAIHCLHQIVTELDRRNTKVLVLDDFEITREWVFIASLLAESLKGRTGIVFSINTPHFLMEFRGFRESFWIEFQATHLSGNTMMWTPRRDEIRSIALDRGAPVWAPFVKCETFLELD